MKNKVLEKDCRSLDHLNQNNMIDRSRLLNWQIISKNRDLLFGLAILWIMIMHSLEFPGISRWDGFKENSILACLYEVIHRGGAGVDIFLFLSGMGLYYSFSKNSDLRLFYEKRLKRVLIPYLIIGGSYLIIRNIIYGGEGLFSVIEDVIWITYYTEGSSTYWYINFILIMYLLFPLIYRLLEGRYRNINLLVLLALSWLIAAAVYYGNPVFYEYIEKSLTRISIFVLGCYWGKVIKAGRNMHDLSIVYALTVPWLGGIFQYISHEGGLPWEISSRIWFGMLAIGVCILAALLFSITQLGIIGKLLKLAGDLSLELYLIHIAMKGLLKQWNPSYRQWGMARSCLEYFVFVILLSFVLAFMYHWISRKITEKVRQKTP